MGGVQGRERHVAAKFVDSCASTRLGQTRLPCDAVFLPNQFFAVMSDASRATGGHYAQGCTLAVSVNPLQLAGIPPVCEDGRPCDSSRIVII